MTRWALVGFVLGNLTLAGQDGSLHLVVLEGDGAINNIRSPRAKEPVVRVEDANKQGVAGAVVDFPASRWRRGRLLWGGRRQLDPDYGRPRRSSGARAACESHSRTVSNPRERVERRADGLGLDRTDECGPGSSRIVA